MSTGFLSLVDFLNIGVGGFSTLLIIDLLFEIGPFWLLRDFDAEWNVRGLDDVTPEASHHDLVP